MTFLELAKNRYSCRKYKDEKVDKKDIDKILEAASLAPTACNKQPQKIIVVNSKEGLESIKKCTYSRYNPPLVFIVCFNNDETWVRDFDGKHSGEVDASIVTTHMMLEAEELGYGTTWIMHFMPDEIKKEFNLNDNEIPLALLYVGIKDKEPSLDHNKRKNLKDYVIYK